jgi:hypothetical protein
MSCQISSLFLCLVMEYSNDSFQKVTEEKRKEHGLGHDMSSPLGEDKGERVGEGGVSECRRLLGM